MRVRLRARSVLRAYQRALARERASELACAFASERVLVQWVGYGLLCGMCQAFRGCSVTFGGAAITAFARASGAILEYCVGNVLYAFSSFFSKKMTPFLGPEIGSKSGQTNGFDVTDHILFTT